MVAALTRLVWQRAQGRCEYCQMPQAADDATFEIDHIRSRKHHGPTVAGNLCLSCYYCNSFKGSDLTSFDKQTRKITPLFNPRRHKSAMHFRWEGPYLIGRTAIGRVTVALLHINGQRPRTGFIYVRLAARLEMEPVDVVDRSRIVSRRRH